MRNRDIILVLDFGSQYTQLIARRIRESKVFSRIVPYNISIEEIKKINPKGLIFSGGPMSVYDKGAPLPKKEIFKLKVPILGICYGAQLITHMLGGKVKKTDEREYGRAELFIDAPKDIFFNLPSNLTCWMSHGDEIKKVPDGFKAIAHTLSTPVAGFSERRKKIYAVQFHPEVVHTQRGNQILANFLFQICGCLPRWTMDKLVKQQIKEIKEIVKDKQVVMGLSGGVDSSVAAVLINQAIGKRLHCIFVDNGVLRKNEVTSVQRTFKNHFKMNLQVIDAQKRFLTRLKNVTDPEQKRKIIGDEFIKVFQEVAKRKKKVEFLGQGTLYPDVIESSSPLGGPSVMIKSHHNVGGLPKRMKLKLIEPFRELFKDEVRQIGKYLGVPENIVKRQPFPGPGLAIRIVGEVTKERLEIIREADERVLEEIRKAGLYDEIWQSFAVLLPIKSVGVMGDKRTYENAIAVRCVNSVDGMTADWVTLPPDLLAKIANRIINEVPGVNRVVYDISSKPPATIEWE
ncbi:MAG: glutamine-hydrolyzing GMP synthase [Candidatus Aceula meridiana]|nr:glutamine-hydrolyzing GMP synthase [Candidatus Aceula meridiana]